MKLKLEIVTFNWDKDKVETHTSISLSASPPAPLTPPPKWSVWFAPEISAGNWHQYHDGGATASEKLCTILTCYFRYSLVRISYLNILETGILRVRWFPLCCRLWNNWASLECWERAGIVHRQAAACLRVSSTLFPGYFNPLQASSHRAGSSAVVLYSEIFRRGHRSGIWGRHGGRAAATEEIYQKYFGWINEAAAAGKVPGKVVFVCFACTVHSLTCLLEDDFWFWLRERRKKTILCRWNIPGREQFLKQSTAEGNNISLGK